MLPFAGCLGVEFKDVGRMVCFVLEGLRGFYGLPRYNEMERDEVKTFMKDYGQKPRYGVQKSNYFFLSSSGVFGAK